MRTSVLHSALAAAVVVGIAACKGPDSLDTNLNSFGYRVRGANVIPAPTTAADTLPEGGGTINTSTGAWTYATVAAPSGTIDSIAVYQNGAGAALGATATFILCSTAATCGTGSGTGTLVGTNTLASITTSMRGYGSQLVVFTTTKQKAAGGAMRGTIYPVGS